MPRCRESHLGRPMHSGFRETCHFASHFAFSRETWQEKCPEVGNRILGVLCIPVFVKHVILRAILRLAVKHGKRNAQRSGIASWASYAFRFWNAAVPPGQKTEIGNHFSRVSCTRSILRLAVTHGKRNAQRSGITSLACHVRARFCV